MPYPLNKQSRTFHLLALSSHHSLCIFIRTPTMAVSSSSAAASLSSIPRFSTSLSSSLPFHARLSHQTFHHSPPLLLSPKLKSPPKSLKLTSQALSLPLLRLLYPAGIFRSTAASDDLEVAVEDEVEAEVELSGSETDQLLEQEHEEEQKGEEEGEGEGKKPASSDDGRLYVGNLPFSITSSQLAEIFAEAGAVRSVEIIYDRVTDRSRGFAFVTMETVEDAENAIRMLNSSQIGGRSVKVNFPEVPKGGERKVLEPKIKTSYQSFVDSPNKVYAGNLSWNVTSQGLRETFSDQPGFLSANVIFERGTGKSRGFGFVSFSSAEEAGSAITAMNGVELEGRALRLNMASERARSSPSPVDPRSEESVESLSSVDPSSEESVESPSPVDPSSEESVEYPSLVDPRLEESVESPSLVDPSLEESVESPSSVDSSSEESVEESEVLSGVSS